MKQEELPRNVHELRSLTDDIAMPAWSLRCSEFRVPGSEFGERTLNFEHGTLNASGHEIGIQARKDASGDIRVDLDPSTPYWNDAIERALLELTEGD